MRKEHYDFTIKVYTKEEYENYMKSKLNRLGLYKSVEDILDDIIDENRNFNYAHFSLMAEWCRDILKLIEMSEKESD